MTTFGNRVLGGARVLIWCGAAGIPAVSGAGVLHLVPAASRVEYHIDHSVQGVTNVAGPVSGVAETDANGTLQSGMVEVDLRGLQTGIGMRDRHVKSEECLDVERFPTARFTLQPPSAVSDSLPGAPPASTLADSASPAADSSRARGAVQPDSLLALGTMELHGQTHELRVPLQIDREGAGLWVRGRFTFTLADWGIQRPKKFMLAAGKTVDVRLDLHFAP